jgi:4-amino-4-deoxy-L-arabinose transferase-like glycosyltransferase
MPTKKSLQIVLIIIVLAGAALRFYKLDWGEGLFFHPDESNIANVVLNIPRPFSPDFFSKGTFSYGSFIPYSVFFINYFTKNLPLPDSFDNTFRLTVLNMRFISAFFSSLTIILVYFTLKKYWERNIALVTAGLVAFSPGLIQSAHFGTFESVLIFLYLAIFYFCLSLLQTGKDSHFIASLFLIGISSAIKINSLILLPIPVLTLLFRQFKKRDIKKLIIIPPGIVFTLLITLIFSPYYLTQSFSSMFLYEQHVVTGTLDVFYTRQFIGTVPVIFQFIKILPYISNPFVIISFLISSLFITFIFFKKILTDRKIYFSPFNLMLFIFWIILFFPNAFLFTKWTRYTLLSLPFLLILLPVFLHKLFKYYFVLISVILLGISFIYSLMFESVYFNKDVRISSSEWIYQNIKDNSFILSETANVVDIPVPLDKPSTLKNYKVVNFDFYNLDADSTLFTKLIYDLEKSDYIFIPSRRIFISTGQKSNKYTLVAKYYQLLFSGRLGFEEIKVFNSFPQLAELEIPDESAEETWSVFDHPVIRIYKKVTPYTKAYYEKLFKI